MAISLALTWLLGSEVFPASAQEHRPVLRTDSAAIVKLNDAPYEASEILEIEVGKSATAPAAP